MGLDSVELVLAIEEHFNIEIPDSVAETLITVGKLSDFVEQELHRVGRGPPDSETVFNKVRELICDQLAVGPDRVFREARFREDLELD